ncbi:hypothetical protein Moror_11061 [Moniliophthora roreri MCA 2997]|nr:hypothetical protein Moror_11061 [Moniliophthora roreri MCA 2997]
MHGFIIDPDFNPKLRSKRTTSNRLPQSNESPQSNEPPEPIEHEDDRGPLEMFSGASEFTVLGGQYNVVRGNQVNLGGPHMIIYPSIQFNTGFRPDQFTIDGIPIFLYQQLLDFASSLDMFIVQLLLLLAYRSFETQIIQLLSHAPLYQLVN